MDSLTKLNISQNRMCVGDMTTNISKTKTNGRWPRQTEYCSNQRLYFPVHTIPQQHPRPIWTKYFWTRRTNIELTLTMTQKQRNKIPNIHEVYHDDQEIMISPLNQKDKPLGQQEPNTKGCSTQRTSYKRT